MADRQDVAKRDGAFRTNKVTVEPRYFLAPGYELAPFDQREVSDTGHHKVFRVSPSHEQVTAPRFFGRWDEKANALDFDLVDRQDRVLKPKPHGHHPKALGDRRFEVDLGPAANKIVFKGIVSVALGFWMHLEAGAYLSIGFNAELIRGTGTGPDAAP